MSNGVRRTVGREAEATLEEKKSVFIASVAPADSEQACRAFLESVRHRYADANHHVYAYDLSGGVISRYSDDSEPQGTAGMPVLNVIKMSGATDLCLVVTRYFGGTLLGTGGLARAYSGAAKMALEAAGIVSMEPCAVFSVHCSYGDYQKLTVYLPRMGVREEETVFEGEVSFLAVIPEGRGRELETMVSETTGGRSTARLLRVEERASEKINTDCRKK